MGKREDLQREMQEILKRNREAFLGEYKDHINELLGMSRADIDAITPDTTDLQTYDALIEVVKDASRQNLATAELKNRIEQMGAVAVKIAKAAPSLAALFV